jgi:hypothetical protein
MSVFVSHPNGHGGIADGTKSQVNNFNQLFRAIEYERAQEDYSREHKNKIDLSLNAYNNSYVQIPNSLEVNAHKYAQKVKPSVVNIVNREYELNGRDLSIFRPRWVNVSDIYYKSTEVPFKPTLISHQDKFGGIIS